MFVLVIKCLYYFILDIILDEFLLMIYEIWMLYFVRFVDEEKFVIKKVLILRIL